MSETRTYTKGELSVLWQPDLCTHCEDCYFAMPEVFNPNRRPWVDLSRATDDAIVKQVGECPSGALSIVEPQQ